MSRPVKSGSAFVLGGALALESMYNIGMMILTEAQIKMVQEALLRLVDEHQQPEYAEIRIIIKRGKIRFMETVVSHEMPDSRFG